METENPCAVVLSITAFSPNELGFIVTTTFGSPPKGLGKETSHLKLGIPYGTGPQDHEPTCVTSPGACARACEGQTAKTTSTKSAYRTGISCSSSGAVLELPGRYTKSADYKLVTNSVN